MPNQLSLTDAIIGLHKKLYYIEGEKNKISPQDRQRLYNIIKSCRTRIDNVELKEVISFVDKNDLEYIENVRGFTEKRNIKILTINDPEYPDYNLSDPPPVLFIQGLMPDFNENPYIGIVGARKCTNYGRNATNKIVNELQNYNVTIVSGLAYGIDAESHRAAIRNCLPTVAVLGCGINVNYPASHSYIAEKIAENGAVVSEFPWSTPPLKHNFPLRNRIISSMSKGVIVIEAAIKSGSLITARWAAEQSKEVFAVPGNIDYQMSKGTNLLIREGAHLIEDGFEVADILNLEKKKLIKKDSGHTNIENDIKQDILTYLASDNKNLDRLAQKTGLAVTELLPLITEIEIMM